MKNLKVWTPRRGPLPEEWQDRIAILWEEDDARTPDRERGSTAFCRMRDSFATMKIVARKDWGDSVAILYEDGWVDGGSCGLDWVGVVVV